MSSGGTRRWPIVFSSQPSTNWRSISMAQSKKRKLPPNPNDIFGVVKTPLNLVPPVGTAWTAAAFADGAAKYGAFNWRENNVQADIYIAAAKRHMDLWFEGQRLAPDSGVHHL